MALKRLYSVEDKMARDSDYGSAYCKKINDYISKNYCRKVEVNELLLNPQRVFYLPHFGVKNVNKIGIRIVFDAAAEVKNVSLNKCLLSEPNMNNSLISTIFREAPIAACGDIKKMFHQVKIAKDDQDCQRFLWRNGDKNKRVETFVMQRLIFGATCSPTIAQYVKNMNANMFVKESLRAVEAIVNRHYVDDYVDCFQNKEEAAEMVSEAGINVSFVMGKSACAPTRYHTIPKLELQTAVMAVRMKDLFVSNHVKSINNIYFWTDSHTVIRWIQSDHRKYKQYVANRVAENLDSSEMHNWKWCPGILNPADETTRAKFPIRYKVHGRWKNGLYVFLNFNGLQEIILKMFWMPVTLS
ncbi:uncharacterized protein LOC109614484 [Musca domestica]|uniref:Uncharacterized protein LOC109614484 n=1 Tax=Musca domestica TaxID=7370 RepID=A0ABM3UZ09_MUSDO|nr:uncharacterized protein LOC109614484 [Musca domestica]XP_058978771.1 uncharacterized protein LOC109614484 [Musca domestica]XP_058978772.1 uncharacterized protein LOC109614484 [Musca domestica]